MKSIPRFALYGTQAQPDWIDLPHFERIPDRARLFDREIEPHVHDALIQVLVPRKGGGSVLIDGSAWPLKPPCIVVVPARCVHGFRFTPGTDGAVLTAAQRRLETVAKAIAPLLLGSMRRPAVIRMDPKRRHAEALRPLVDAIERESATRAPGQAAAGRSLLMALLVQIARLVEGGAGGVGSVGDGAGDGTVARPRAGDRVLHEAQRELAYSSLSIKQIAADLGFDDDAHIGRFFKKQTGHRPTEFRALARRRLAVAHGGAGQGRQPV